MAIDFNLWNDQFGGDEALKALKEAAENGNDGFSELPDGEYVTVLEKLELGESKEHKPMIKGMFRIVEGKHKKQCLFYNQVFCRSASGSAFPMHKALEFLRSMNVYEAADVDFDGDYADFADLLLDMAEDAEGMHFTIQKSKDGEFTRLEVIDVD